MKKKDLISKSIYAAAALLVLPFTSCNSDRLQTEDGADGTPVDVSLSIVTKAATADQEAAVKTLRVYAFQDSQLKAYHQAGTAEITGSTYTFKMKLPAKETRFYVIANEAGAGTLLLNNTGNAYTLPDNQTPGLTETDFSKITFNTLPTEESIVQNGIPMSGMQTEVITKETKALTLGIERSIAKLNLYFAKKGTGEVYMSRGSYLYNTPQYGYLFADASYSGGYNHLEGNGDNSDSRNNQKNGQVLISSGWRNEPADYNGATTARGDLTINPVTKEIETRDQINVVGNYNYIPAQPTYLFANPAVVSKENSKDPKLSQTKGYYMKFIWYQTFLDNRGQVVQEYPTPTYISFPAVKANDNLQLFAHISIYGHKDISFNWMVAGWEPAGGDIEFN